MNKTRVVGGKQSRRRRAHSYSFVRLDGQPEIRLSDLNVRIGSSSFQQPTRTENMVRRKANAGKTISVNKANKLKPLSMAKQMKAYNVLYQQENHELAGVGSVIRAVGIEKRGIHKP